MTTNLLCKMQNQPNARCYLLNAARQYAEEGVPVFPCNTNKQPLTPHGFKDATTDRKAIIDLWAKNLDALIGMPTGKTTGVVVIDLDIDPANGIDGRKTFAGLLKAKNITITTRKHRTPRGGIHLLLQYPDDGFKNSTSKLAKGVDTRGDGGYIILPPSRSGKGSYTIENDIELSPITPSLKSLLCEYGIIPDPKTPQTGTTTPHPRTMPAGCPPSVAELIRSGASQGQRNDRAFWIATQLRDEGHTETGVLDYCFAFAGNCTPPLPEHEVRRTVHSAFSQAPREPARNPAKPPPRAQAQVFKQAAVTHVLSETTPEAPEAWETPVPFGGLSEPPPPWPWEAMPPVLRDMGKAITETYNVAPEMAAAAVLGVASVALGNKARVAIKADHKQFANLFFMVVADVGDGKTPVTRAAIRPLVTWQTERRETWKAEDRSWQARKAVAEARIKGLEEVAKRAYKSTDKQEKNPEIIEIEIAQLKAEIGERPPEPLLFCGDATSEALGRKMQENKGKIGVISGEGRKILDIVKGRYMQGGDADLWLAGHAGDFLRVDRNAKDKPSYEIPEACLAAVLMTQPDSLQSLGDAPHLRDSGFLARWLYIIPEQKTGEYPIESVPSDIAEAYSRLIRALIELPISTDENNRLMPQAVELSPYAFDYWRAYHNTTREEITQHRETQTSFMTSWLTKLPETTARIALLFHCCNKVEQERFSRIDGDYNTGKENNRIEQAEMEAAKRVADALTIHARRAAALIGGDAEIERARRAWDWINKNRQKLKAMRAAEGLQGVEAVKPRDLDRNGVAGVANSREAETILCLLADKGYLQPVEIKTLGAKNIRLFYIHPPDIPDFPDKASEPDP